LRARDLRRARREVGIEKVGGRGRLDPARLLHQLVLGEELERYRARAAHELVEKDLELAARAIDQIACRLDLGRSKLLEPRELALELVGIGRDRVEADHLDCAGGLMNVCARVLERGFVARRRLVARERFNATRQRLVDFSLDPGERAEIEIGSRVDGHAVSGDSLLPVAVSKKRAADVGYSAASALTYT